MRRGVMSGEVTWGYVAGPSAAHLPRRLNEEVQKYEYTILVSPSERSS